MARGKTKTAGRDLIRNIVHMDQMFPGGIIPAAGSSAAGRPEKINPGKSAIQRLPRPDKMTTRTSRGPEGLGDKRQTA